jgi:hypothetical protein
VAGMLYQERDDGYETFSDDDEDEGAKGGRRA